MRSNLEQTILQIIDNKQPPTVAGVFGTYIRISGLDEGDAGRSIAAFERALDKHPPRNDSVSNAVATVRNEYWYTKLGGSKDGGGQCHTCEHCGQMTLPGSTMHRHKNLRIASDTSNGSKLAKSKKAQRRKSKL